MVDTNTIYLIAAVVILHFIIGIGYILYKILTAGKSD